MGKNKIRSIIIHRNNNAHTDSLSSRVNEFHVQVIERKLGQLYSTAEQKIAVIDEIIGNLKLREVNGFIK